MRKLFIVALLAACLGFGSVKVLADIQSHRQAADELARLLHMESLLQQSYEQMLDIQVQANPALRPYRDTMLKFFQQHMSWDVLKDDLLGLYSEHFSESELQELIAFYSTETGQKSVNAMPEIMRRAGEIGMKRMQANLPELEKTLQQAGSASQ